MSRGYLVRKKNYNSSYLLGTRHCPRQFKYTSSHLNFKPSLATGTIICHF